MTIKEWLDAAPPVVLQCLQSVPMMNNLRMFRNTLFQMAGRYDGSMSKECKERCLSEFSCMTELVATLEKRTDGK